MTCDHIVESYDLRDLYNCSSRRAPAGYTRLALRALSRPGWLWTMLRESPATRPFTMVPQSIYDAVGTPKAQPHRKHTTTRRLLQDSINLTELSTANWGLLSRNPATSLLRMGTLTGQYYTQQRYDAPPPLCANNSNWMTCAGFKLPPSRNASTLPPWAVAVEVVMLVPTLGGSGLAAMDALLSDMPYDQATSDDYVTAHRLTKDLSACNYTALMLGPDRPRNILAVALLSVLLVALISVTCSPGGAFTYLLWMGLLPMLVLWGTYTLSPLCFPLVPPTLMRDVYRELQRLVPATQAMPGIYC